MDVTLVPVEFAKEGVEFQYLGPSQECRECKLKNVCLRLEEGKWYRVVGIRGNEHECKIHNNGKVVSVEVEEIPAKIALPRKIAIEGSTVQYSPVKCRNKGCIYYEYCRPYKLRGETKIKIEKLLGEIDCPLKLGEFSLVLARW